MISDKALAAILITGIIVISGALIYATAEKPPPEEPELKVGVYINPYFSECQVRHFTGPEWTEAVRAEYRTSISSDDLRHVYSIQLQLKIEGKSYTWDPMESVSITGPAGFEIPENFNRYPYTQGRVEIRPGTYAVWIFAFAPADSADQIIVTWADETVNHYEMDFQYDAIRLQPAPQTIGASTLTTRV